MDSEDDSPRAVLARNLGKLMQATKGARTDLSSPHRIQAHCGFSKSHLYRIAKEETAATVDMLGELAAAFHLAPWQLLVPGLQASQDVHRRLHVETPVAETAPPQSAKLKHAHDVIRELSEEDRLSLYASIQAQPASDAEVERRIPITMTRPATKAEEIIKGAKIRDRGPKKAAKKSA
jgi:hypothetical protein